MSSAKKTIKLISDSIAAVKKQYADHALIKDIEWDRENPTFIRFSISTNAGKFVNFSIMLAEEYPRGEPILMLDSGDMIELKPGEIPGLLGQVISKYGVAPAAKAPPPKSATVAASSQNKVIDLDYAEDGDSAMPDLQQSHYDDQEEAEEEEEEEEVVMFLDNNDDDGTLEVGITVGGGMEQVSKKEVEKWAARIRADVEQARVMVNYGQANNSYCNNKKRDGTSSSSSSLYHQDGKVGLFCLEETSNWIVRVTLDTSFIDSFTATALCIDVNKRIVVELEFSWDYIDAAQPPKLIGICQSSDNDLNVPKLKDVNTGFGSLKWYLENRLSTALRKNWVNKKEALKQAKEQNQSEAATPAPSSFSSSSSTTTTNNNNSNSNNKDDANKGKEVNKNSSNSNSNDASVVEEAIDPLLWKKGGGIFEAPLFNTNLKYEHDTENFFANGNIICGIIRYMNYRLANCSSHCIICGDALGFAGIKPAICEKLLCSHSLYEYGLGIDVLSEITHNPQVVDLLISLTCACALNSSYGQRDSFTPFPAQLEYMQRSLKAGDTNDMKLVHDTLQKIPALSVLVNAAAGSTNKLKAHLDAIDPLAYPLLRWVLATNRAHLAPLPEGKKINSIDAVQFVLASSNPEKERRFRQRRQKLAGKKGKRGSFYAFHGSSAFNWHSILRVGLKNFSNTKMMSAGAAAGPGIYLAKHMTTSVGYMGPAYKGWQNGQFKSFTCMALCEVLDERGINPKLHEHIWGYVVEEENLVTTRFFLVWPFSGSAHHINGYQKYSAACDADSIVVPSDLFY